MGFIRDHSGLHPGDCLSALHVRYDPDRSIVPKAGDEGGLAGGLYDGFHPAESAADHLQCRTRLGGLAAGLLVFLFFRNRDFFDFSGFEERASHDTHPNLFIRYLLNVWRNVKATGMYFFFGILLSAIFQRYVPSDLMSKVFGGNEAWGVLMAATVGVPLYACGGGTIPLLRQWLWEGMSMGSAAAFMITGPATKITNLGALKIVMGLRRFLLYLTFVMLFSLLAGILVNALMTL